MTTIHYDASLTPKYAKKHAKQKRKNGKEKSRILCTKNQWNIFLSSALERSGLNGCERKYDSLCLFSMKVSQLLLGRIIRNHRPSKRPVSADKELVTSQRHDWY